MSEWHKRQYEKGVIATTSGEAPKQLDSPAPDPEVKENGQHRDYWILSDQERAKGFVRPVRETYRHVGIAGPKYPTRELDEQQKELHKDIDWILYEEYPEGPHGRGRFWTQAELDRVGKGCGVVTRMSRAIAETYARQPHFYGSTFCVGCGVHLPVGAYGEFVWEGTSERVGT